MSHERAQANLELVFDWMNAMRYRDIDTIGRLFDPAVVWVDVAGGVACNGRDQALAWLRATPTELNEVDAVELLANDEHVVLGIRNHAREELAGVPLEDGRELKEVSPDAVDVSSVDEAKRVASLAEEERRIIEAERRRLGLDS